MDNYKNLRLPAEWEPHRSTVLCWPHQKNDWPGKFMPIPWVYAEIVKNSLPGEPVFILVQSAEHLQKVRKILERAHVPVHNIKFIITETDRGWMRDTSPVFIKTRGETKAVHFLFNGWAKYSNWKKDKNIPEILAGELNVELIPAIYNDTPVVLEGGAIDSNGNGTLLTTEECLIDKKIQVRNPGFSKKDYEDIFRDYLGITNVIWLAKGIAGDDTHGHVDDLCRFVNHNTVLLCREKNSREENYNLLEENFERLQSARLEDGSRLKVFDLPMPKPLYFENLRLPASYANFYITNNAVLVPTFNDPNDKLALNIIKDFFPDREVIGIHAVDLVWGLGTLHCLSHEVPL
ncbi:MAG: agmatine deiminase family protein [Bacteroidales bacterium]|nr:agmatine deiminase family protein [Bacteroidales bacterium]